MGDPRPNAGHAHRARRFPYLPDSMTLEEFEQLVDDGRLVPCDWNGPLRAIVPNPNRTPSGVLEADEWWTRRKSAGLRLAFDRRNPTYVRCVWDRGQEDALAIDCDRSVRRAGGLPSESEERWRRDVERIRREHGVADPSGGPIY